MTKLWGGIALAVAIVFLVGATFLAVQKLQDEAQEDRLLESDRAARAQEDADAAAQAGADFFRQQRDAGDPLNRSFDFSSDR